ncbi:MAG: response regulator [Candidatus Marinimicrobia bacterium]|nr:response regulator [Candidatus Neomarinimicrobiota bacterium]
MKKVLVIDDDSEILKLLEKILVSEGYKVFTEGSAEGGLKSFELNSPDLIFTDIELPGISGLNFLEQIKKENPDIPVIVITGTGGMHTAIDAAQFSAFEYVEKPLEMSVIKEIAQRALEAGEIKEDDDIITLSILGNAVHDDIIGKSDAIKGVFRRIGELIRTPLSSPILITGEIGTGKELIANTIHSKCNDSAKSPFISLNCGAFSDEELYALMFGSTSDMGELQAVGSGTLYIRESFRMSDRIRSKLLSVITNGEYRIDSSPDVIEFHGRIISSVTTKTDTDINSSSRAKDELHYLLNEHEINVPPLSERKEDIPLLAVQEMLRSSGRLGKKMHGISNQLIEQLSEYNFPGNVRELKNIIGESVIRSRSKILRVSDLPESFSSKTQGMSISGKVGKKDEEVIYDSRGLLAIFFADMVGYTALMQESESEARKLIKTMRASMKPIIEDFGGKILRYVADETLCTFSSAIMSVTAAVEVQKLLREQNLLKIRIGIHVGDVAVEGNEIYGDGVNVASRLEPLAAPGEICISQDVYNHVHNQANIKAESMGAQNLKNVKFEVQVYRVVIE